MLLKFFRCMNIKNFIISTKRFIGYCSLDILKCILEISTYIILYGYYNTKVFKLLYLIKLFSNIIIKSSFKINLIKDKQTFKNFIFLQNINYKDVQYKILKINTISKVLSKGVLRRFNVISLLSSKQGWFGIGFSKNCFLLEAIENSYYKTFSNIHYIPLDNKGILYALNVKCDFICKSNNTFNKNIKSNNMYKIILESIGVTNLTVKRIKNINISKLYNIF